MSHRIKNSDLYRLVRILNKSTGNPVNYFSGITGEFTSNPGHYYISTQHGGSRLEQLCDGGGARDVSPRLPKGQLYNWMDAMLNGIHIGLKIAKEGLR